MRAWVAAVPVCFALLLPSVAEAGKRRAIDVAPPSDPLVDSLSSDVTCESTDRVVKVTLPQPDNSTFASGPGECWLTMHRAGGATPLRFYVGIFSAQEAKTEGILDDSPQSAADWSTRTKLYRQHVEIVESDELVLGNGKAKVTRLRGRPMDGPTPREALVAHVQRAGHDIVILAHYDAYNRDGLEERARAVLSTLTITPGGDKAPAVAEAPAETAGPDDAAVADAPAITEAPIEPEKEDAAAEAPAGEPAPAVLETEAPNRIR